MTSDAPRASMTAWIAWAPGLPATAARSMSARLGNWPLSVSRIYCPSFEARKATNALAASGFSDAAFTP